MKKINYKEWKKRMMDLSDPKTGKGILLMAECSEKDLPILRERIRDFQKIEFYVVYTADFNKPRVIQLDSLEEFDKAEKFTRDNAFEKFDKLRDHSIIIRVGGLDLRLYIPLKENREILRRWSDRKELKYPENYDGIPLPE